jgi:beta-xylosidase
VRGPLSKYLKADPPKGVQINTVQRSKQGNSDFNPTDYTRKDQAKVEYKEFDHENWMVGEQVCEFLGITKGRLEYLSRYNLVKMERFKTNYGDKKIVRKIYFRDNIIAYKLEMV